MTSLPKTALGLELSYLVRFIKDVRTSVSKTKLFRERAKSNTLPGAAKDIFDITLKQIEQLLASKPLEIDAPEELDLVL